jgi:hypothetical protein
MSLEGALGKVAGVKQATVDVPAPRSPNPTPTVDALVAAVEGQGYEVAKG